MSKSFCWRKVQLRVSSFNYFPGNVRPIEQTPIHLHLEEVTVCAGHEDLPYISLIVGYPHGIIDQ
jgi:hypothetical protein